MSQIENNSEKYFGRYSVLLRKLVPLSDLPDHKFKELLDQLALENGISGSELFRQGDSTQEFFYLLEGEIEFRIGEIGIQTVSAGTPEATFALAHQFPRRTSAVAITPIRYLRIPNDLMVSIHADSEKQNDKNSTTHKNASNLSENTSIETILNRIESDSIASAQVNSTQPREDETKNPSHWFAPPKGTFAVDRLKAIIKECQKHLQRSTLNIPKKQQEQPTESEQAASNDNTHAVEHQLAGKPPSLRAPSTRAESDTKNTNAEKQPQAPKTEIKTGPSKTQHALFKLIHFNSHPESTSEVQNPKRELSTNSDMASMPGKTLVSAYDSVILLVPPFLLDKTLVTNKAYLAFTQETGERLPEYWQCKGPKNSEMDHPVTGISLEEARRFAQWSGKRLPTTREWEAASRPIGQFKFPWGDDWDPLRCNSPDAQINTTSAVGSFPRGASPEGCQDLIGNVWEWTEISEEDTPPDPGYCWVYGGSFRHACVKNNATPRTAVLPENRYAYLGFRCAKDLDQ